jgi:hypothetical protein
MPGVMLTIMDTEDQIEDLVDTLGAALSEYRYTEREIGELDNIPFIARLMTPRRRTTRYICAISRVPRNVRDLPAILRRYTYVPYKTVRLLSLVERVGHIFRDTVWCSAISGSVRGFRCLQRPNRVTHERHAWNVFHRH